jgi:hypothetical protein
MSTVAGHQRMRSNPTPVSSTARPLATVLSWFQNCQRSEQSCQIRRVIGREPPLDETAIHRRAGVAFEQFFRLNSPSGKS